MADATPTPSTGFNLKETLKKEVVKDTGINIATLLGLALGAGVLYMMIPEKKRLNLFN